MVGRVEKRVDHSEPRPAYDRYTVVVDMPEKWNTLLGWSVALEAFKAAGVPEDAYIQVGYPQSYANWERPA